MAQLVIKLLGGFTVTLDGEPVTGFDSNKVRALLAYLAVEPDHVHRRESLAALLWPGYPERSARTNLRNALSNLRTVIGDRSAEPPYLQTTRETVQFNAASDHCMDTASVKQAATSPETLSADELVAASDLYEGDFLAGFTLADAVAFDNWAATTRERVRGQALDLLGEVVGRLEADGDAERAITYARRRVGLAPWREDAQRELIQLLAETGQRSAALRQYRACVRALEEELGAEPSAETTALYEELQAGDLAVKPGADWSASQEPQRPAPPRHNLPSVALPIVGRDQLLAEVAGYLHDPTRRLVTLVGPGGSGKTRLALEVGHRELPRYSDGVFFVSLAVLRNPTGVWSAMAESIGLQPGFAQPGQAPVQLQDQLAGYLREKHVLLILDNAEHLLSVVGGDGLREAITVLLSASPGVTFLVTSRARLNMLREQVVPIPGVDFAPPSNGAQTALTPAAQLFAQVARRTSPGFAVATCSRAAVDEVCQAVEGMPLAILLAASWVDVLTPAEIAEQLTGAEGEGMACLAADWADMPDRHRSLTAVLDRSWGLLTSEEQAGFAALSIFQGSFTRRSAEAVVGTSLRVLRSLVAKSMVEVAGEGYRLHPLMREYATKRSRLQGRRMPWRRVTLSSMRIGLRDPGSC